jgi:DNA-binding NtrC family response regulator
MNTVQQNNTNNTNNSGFHYYQPEEQLSKRSDSTTCVYSTLLITQDSNFRKQLEQKFNFYNYKLDSVSDLTLASTLIKKFSYECIILTEIKELKTHLVFISEVKRQNPKTQILICTEYKNINFIHELLLKGADDFILKDSLSDLDFVLNRVKMLCHHFQCIEQLDISKNFLGKSQSSKKILEQIKKLKGSFANVLITGESGTGKEVIAKAIHDLEQNAERPFVVINCGAISDELFESEMFGHIKGSFTNAYQNKKGLVEIANQGDLFLDEVADLSLANQVKLLRFLESGEFKAVGSNQVQYSKTRVIAATNKNLEDLVKTGKFREDLYYRLNVVRINTIPLRERVEDIVVLAKHFLDNISDKQFRIDSMALNLIKKQKLLGNARELRNIIERLYLNAKSSGRTEIELVDVIKVMNLDSTLEDNKQSHDSLDINELTLKDFLEKKEKEYICRALLETDYNIEEAARLSSVSRSSFYEYMKKHKIDGTRKKRNPIYF